MTGSEIPQGTMKEYIEKLVSEHPNEFARLYWLCVAEDEQILQPQQLSNELLKENGQIEYLKLMAGPLGSLLMSIKEVIVRPTTVALVFWASPAADLDGSFSGVNLLAPTVKVEMLSEVEYYEVRDRLVNGRDADSHAIHVPSEIFNFPDPSRPFLNSFEYIKETLSKHPNEIKNLLSRCVAEGEQILQPQQLSNELLKENGQIEYLKLMAGPLGSLLMSIKEVIVRPPKVALVFRASPAADLDGSFFGVNLLAPTVEVEMLSEVEYYKVRDRLVNGRHAEPFWRRSFERANMGNTDRPGATLQVVIGVMSAGISLALSNAPAPVVISGAVIAIAAFGISLSIVASLFLGKV